MLIGLLPRRTLGSFLVSWKKALAAGLALIILQIVSSRNLASPFGFFAIGFDSIFATLGPALSTATYFRNSLATYAHDSNPGLRNTASKHTSLRDLADFFRQQELNYQAILVGCMIMVFGVPFFDPADCT
jgi:hypothetical protein